MLAVPSLLVRLLFLLQYRHLPFKVCRMRGILIHAGDDCVQLVVQLVQLVVKWRCKEHIYGQQNRPCMHGSQGEKLWEEPMEDQSRLQPKVNK